MKQLSFTLYLKDVVQSPHYPPPPPWEVHNLENLELRGSLSPSTLKSPTITTLLLRRLYADDPKPEQVHLPALRTVSASQIHQSWLEILARTPTVTSFTMAIAQSAMVFQDLPLISWCGDMFDRLGSFTLEVPPARQLEKSLTPLEIVVGGLKVSWTAAVSFNLREYKLTPHRSAKVSPSAPLRSLTLNVRLQLHQAPSRLSFARCLSALKAFAGVSLTSLALDDYVLVYPADLEALAEAFPTLTKLAFGDRTVWSGSRVRIRLNTHDLREPVKLARTDIQTPSRRRIISPPSLASLPSPPSNALDGPT